MPKYRNTRTGRVVDVPDQAPTRTHRPKRDKQWAININQLDRSQRWERVDGPAPDEGGEPEPKPAEVRKWAKENDIEVPARRPLPDEVIEQYKEATDG